MNYYPVNACTNNALCEELEMPDLGVVLDVFGNGEIDSFALAQTNNLEMTSPLGNSEVDSVTFSVLKNFAVLDVSSSGNVDPVTMIPEHNLHMSDVDGNLNQIDSFAVTIIHSLSVEDVDGDAHTIDAPAMVQTNDLTVLDVNGTSTVDYIFFGDFFTERCQVLPAPREPDAGIIIDQSDDGLPRSRRMYNETTYRFTVRYEYLTDSERRTIEGFWKAYKDREFLFVWDGDQQEYLCKFVNEPTTIPVVGRQYHFESEIVGRLAAAA